MSREIKFRGKTFGFNRWEYSNGYYDDGTNIWFILPSDNPAIAYSEKRMINRKTIGQYTGLKDKNGKEIYEGDIHSLDTGTFSNTGRGIIREYKGMYVSFYGQDALGRDCFDALSKVCNEREVIGNIHDNQELLEEVFNRR